MTNPPALKNLRGARRIGVELTLLLSEVPDSYNSK
jgi:hypothetical protein